MDKAYILVGGNVTSVTSSSGGTDEQYLQASIGYEKFFSSRWSVNLELSRAVASGFDLISNSQSIGGSYYFNDGNVNVSKVNELEVIRYSPYVPFVNLSLIRRDFEGETLSFNFLGFSAKGGVDFIQSDKLFYRLTAGMEQIQSGSSRSANVFNLMAGVGISF